MFSKYVIELKMRNNPKDKALMSVVKKDDLYPVLRGKELKKIIHDPKDKTLSVMRKDLDQKFSKCVNELKMRNNPKDKTLMSVVKKDDLNPVLRGKELKKIIHDPKDKTLSVHTKDLDQVQRVKELLKMHENNNHQQNVVTAQVQRVKELKKMHNPKDKTLTFVHKDEDMNPVLSVKELESTKMYDPKDKTLTFVDRQDELDPVSSEDGSLKALMSCGHAVTPESLTGYCRSRLDEGDYTFRCPALVNWTNKCNKIWSYQEVRRLADLSPEEMQYFEKTIVHLAAIAYCETQPCPQCKTYIERTDLFNLCVKCIICAADGAKCSLFCWQCQKPWKGDSAQRGSCGNSGCVNKELQLLKSCRTISLPAVTGATNCPSVRACPTCGLKVEHNQQFCKNIPCPRCQVNFCFICLKLKSECSQTSSPYEMCVSGVAPRQTSIPIWHRK